MNNLEKLPLLENYILENGATAKFTVPFLTRKNKFNVELQNWADYQDLKKGIITIRQSGIRVKAPDYYPCLTHNSAIPIIYENGYRYLNKEELLALQSFPSNYQFPVNYSLTKIASLLGNSVNVEVVKQFIKKQNIYREITSRSSLLNGIIIWRDGTVKITNFMDLFAGIGGFHLALKDDGQCVLAVDINKNSQETYQLNFPTTPFLLGNINDKQIQKQVINTDFELLCAGFPCQPFSKAGKNQGTSPELTSLSTIISKKKPKYLLLENVPNLFSSPVFSKFLQSLLTNYQLQMQIINPLDLNLKQNRPRLFIWGELKKKNYE